jgi:ketosteroid isomerase-like protein
VGELIELYRRVLDAFNARDRQAWLELTAPDLENDPPREWPESAVTTGSEAVWEFLVTNFETFEAQDIEIAGPIAEGESCLVVPLRADVRGRESRVPVEWAYQQVAWVGEGRFTRLAWFSDRAEALEAAGIDSGES